MLISVEKGKPGKTGEKTGEKLSQQGQNQNQTQPRLHMAPGRNQIQATFLEGERSRHCANPDTPNLPFLFFEEYPFTLSTIYGPTYGKWLQNVSDSLTLLCLLRKDAFLSAKNL